MTPQDLCTTAAQLIQALGTGETLNADDAATAFAALNQLLDSWKLQPGTLTGVVRSTPLALTASQAAYTVGASGADITRAKPQALQDASIAWYADATNPSEIPLNLIDADQYAAIVMKSTESALPVACYYNPTYSVALGQVTLWPVPNSATARLVLYVADFIAVFTSLSQTITIQPGYQKALVSNLALEIAPIFGMAIPPIVAQMATESLTWVKTSNLDVPLLRCDPAVVSADGGWSGGNWLTGP